MDGSLARRDLRTRLDPALSGPEVGHRSAAHVTGPFRSAEVAGAGHFPHEEQPDAFNTLLLSWLRTL